LVLTGVAAGADGLIVEMHPSPDHAMSDGAQSLDFAQFAAMMPRVKAVAEAVERTLTLQAETDLVTS
jgi:3-deoxy-7-phosphoheptulonate synthase